MDSESALETVERPKLAGIFGAGRSGTTWLGAILDSHPEVAYRFEPFHRLRQHPRIKAARELLDKSELDGAQVETVYHALLPANPVISRPPFFKKTNCRILGRAWLWPMCAKMPILHPLYASIYSPPRGTTVVFKDVALEPVMKRLLERTSVPAVYLVRHPCAVGSSLEEGQAKGVMTTGRLDPKVLKTLLQEHDPQLAAKLGDRVDTLSNNEKNALLWRIDIEQGLVAAKSSSRGMVLIYEELCKEPSARAKDVFRLFGIPFARETEEFIELSSHPSTASRLKSSEYLIADYFSVFKDPKQSMSKWKTKLPREEQRKILAMVEDSFAFQELSARGHWD